MPESDPFPPSTCGTHLDPTSAGRLLRMLDDGATTGTPSVDPGMNAGAWLSGPGETAPPSIPGYTVIARVASGSGGTVYRVIRLDGGSECQFALKMLNVRVGADPAAQRAWRELQVLESLRLPCVPRLIDYGHHDGRLYFVTEFIEGLPPDRYCDQHALDLRGRVGLLARIADAVQFLHEHAVIHRDLKPSNILVTAAGEPVILDLGLVLFAGDVMETLTAQGQPVGTPAFMAPEQARGERDSISTRTDIYSLGALGHVLLTGHTPHDLADISLHAAVQRIANEPARPVRTLEPGLPAALGAVLAKACSREPGKRYGSAEEMARDLRRWLAGEQVEAQAPTRWVRATGWMRKHPRLTTTIGSVFIAVSVVGTTLGLVRWMHNQPYQLRVSPDAQSLWLITRDGNITRQWDSNGRGTVMCSEVERPDEFGGGRLEIVSMASGLGPGLDGNLCAFCIGALDEPEWVARISDEPPERNELLSGPLSGSYTIEVYYTRDVFPQSPGDEIICLYHDWTWSASVLRIYDFRGKVLFEAWHNGWLHSAEWFPALGVLVASGVNSDAMRYQRGEHGGESYPLVVFAIKPELGKTGRWITTPARSGGIDPLWYKCLLPSSATNPLHDPHLDISADPEHAGTIRAYCNGIINEVRTAVVGLDINTEGEVVGRMVWDQYRQLRGGSEEAMPDPDELRLGDLPPIVVQRRPAGTAPAK